MKTALRIPVLAALVLAASRAVAHGPSAGALQPHAHPHADEGFGGLGIALLVVAVAGAVGMVVRALAKRR